jgi:hypothetical protein
MVGNTSFSFRLVGTVGCEIVADGVVVAWTVDELWAAIIVGLLNGAEHGGSHDPATCLKRPADDGQQHLSP